MNKGIINLEESLNRQQAHSNLTGELLSWHPFFSTIYMRQINDQSSIAIDLRRGSSTEFDWMELNGIDQMAGR